MFCRSRLDPSASSLARFVVFAGATFFCAVVHAQNIGDYVYTVVDAIGTTNIEDAANSQQVTIPFASSVKVDGLKSNALVVRHA